MAIFRHRDIEAVVPPEVLRRAGKGVGKGKVDWYAGRRYRSNLKADSMPTASERTDLTEQMRTARRDVKRDSLKARSDKASNVARAIAGKGKRVLASISRRLHRYRGAHTHQI